MRYAEMHGVVIRASHEGGKARGVLVCCVDNPSGPLPALTTAQARDVAVAMIALAGSIEDEQRGRGEP